MATDLKRPPLTYRQEQILEYIRGFIKANGYSPTVREIARATGILSSATAYQHILALEAKGVIARRRNGRHRGIQVVKEDEPPDEADLMLLRNLIAWLDENPWAAQAFRSWQIATGRAKRYDED